MHQLLVESVLQGAGALLVGDPEVLSELDLPSDPGIVSTAAGNAVVLHPDCRAFVWVAGSAAVDRVSVFVHLEAVDREPVPLGHIDCPSGRLVVGRPADVAAWGADAEPADGLIAQARAYRADRRHCGLIVVARVELGPRPVWAVVGDDGFDALLVENAPASTGKPELLIAS